MKTVWMTLQVLIAQALTLSVPVYAYSGDTSPAMIRQEKRILGISTVNVEVDGVPQSESTVPTPLNLEPSES